MNLKLNGNGNGHGRPYLKIGLLAVAVLLVGLLLYRQVDRLAGPQREVWVAKADLARGAVLGPDDFEKKEVRDRRVPEDAVDDPSQLVGRRLARATTAGAPLVAADFAAGGGGGSISGQVPEGRVLMTLRVGSQSLPLAQLRRGDRFDVLAANRRLDSGSVASDVYFVGWIRPQQPGGGREKGSVFGIDLTPPGRPPAEDVVSLLLALKPEDVNRLARAEAGGLRLSIVLHGRSEVQDGRLLELPAPRPSKVELIAGAKRQSVAIKP